jgi:hypothetical protein
MRANFRAILARGEGSTQWPNFAARRPIPPNGRMAEAYLSDWESFGPPPIVDVCVLPQKTAVFRKNQKTGCGLAPLISHLNERNSYEDPQYQRCTRGETNMQMRTNPRKRCFAKVDKIILAASMSYTCVNEPGEECRVNDKIAPLGVVCSRGFGRDHLIERFTLLL